MSAVAADQEPAFDASVYDLPIPTLDGHKADKLVLAFSGQLELDRTSHEDLDFVQALSLGRDVELKVTATVTKKGFTLSPGGEEKADSTGYGVGLKVHSGWQFCEKCGKYREDIPETELS